MRRPPRAVPSPKLVIGGPRPARLGRSPSIAGYAGPRCQTFGPDWLNRTTVTRLSAVFSPIEISRDGSASRIRTEFYLDTSQDITVNVYAEKMEVKERIELSSRAYHARALPLSYRTWRSAPESNRIVSFTKAAHRRQCLQTMERIPGVQPGYSVWKTDAYKRSARPA